METNVKVVLNEITEEKFTLVQENLSKTLGIKIAGDSGRESLDGFTVSWKKEETNVELVCSEKPFYIPDFVIQKELEGVSNVPSSSV